MKRLAAILALLGTVQAAAIANTMAQAPPGVFQAANVGPGGSNFKDSAHFRVYDAPEGVVKATLDMMEGAYDCFVDKLGWRSSGLSINSYNNATAEAAGPFYKENIYAVATLGNAAGQMFSDMRQGLSYVRVVRNQVQDPRVTVHEYGHALTYHEKNWVEQKNTGAWWEPLAEWFSDTYMTSPWCEASRAKYGPANVRTKMEIPVVLNKAHQVLVDGTPNSGNYYQSWPFLSYLVYNPDNFPNMGKDTIKDMIRKYKRGSNQTPLHALEQIATPTKVNTIVGRYWARMAYLDIGHKAGKKLFDSVKARVNYNNLDAESGGAYKVKEARAPRYMGANIIPLKASGPITIKVSAQMRFTATLAVKGAGGNVRYVDLPSGSGGTTVAGGEEASLVVANTPERALMYDAFSINGEAAKGLRYTVTMTGASPR